MKILKLSDNSYHPQDSSTSGGLVLIYHYPVRDFFSSLWTLYHHPESWEQVRVSYLSITLVFTWFLGYLILATGATTSIFLTLHLLIVHNFLTCRYFLINIWLIVLLVKSRLRRLPRP
ncbi:hypothetical protein [Brasilonema bromeliae]|uniref:hypothetical protein n=1 Tax=Brasilonema bromeliae TaxID=383615 RepID=UPI001FE43450|nr:hypothetical protein [Brasilonema bromeliae]